MYGKGINWGRYMTGTEAGVELEYYMWKRHAPVCFRKTGTGVVRIKGKHADGVIHEGELITVPVFPKKHLMKFDEWVRKTKEEENPEIRWAAYIEVEGYPEHAGMVSDACRCVPVDNFFSFCGEPEPDKVREPDPPAPAAATGDDFWKVQKPEPSGDDFVQLLSVDTEGIPWTDRRYAEAALAFQKRICAELTSGEVEVELGDFIESGHFARAGDEPHLYMSVWFKTIKPVRSYWTHLAAKCYDGTAEVKLFRDGVQLCCGSEEECMARIRTEVASIQGKTEHNDEMQQKPQEDASEARSDEPDVASNLRPGGYWEYMVNREPPESVERISDKAAGDGPLAGIKVPSWLDQTLDDMDILWKSAKKVEEDDGACTYTLELCSTPVSEDGTVDDYGTLVVHAGAGKPTVFQALHAGRLVVRWGQPVDFIHDLKEKLPESIRAFNNYHSFTGNMWFDAEQLFIKNDISWFRIKTVEVDNAVDWFWDVRRYDGRREYAPRLVDQLNQFRVQIREYGNSDFYEAWDMTEPDNGVCLVERVEGWQFFADRLVKALEELLPPLVTDPADEPDTKEDQSDGLCLL